MMANKQQVRQWIRNMLPEFDVVFEDEIVALDDEDVTLVEEPSPALLTLARLDNAAKERT
jgi:hypothetical protein